MFVLYCSGFASTRPEAILWFVFSQSTTVLRKLYRESAVPPLAPGLNLWCSYWRS